MLREAVPAAVRGGRHRRRDEVVGIATDFTASHAAAGAAPTARRCAELRGFEDRPHAYAKLWKHHAAQAPGGPDQRAGRRARRAVAGALRRAHLLRVGVREGAAGARGGPGGLRARWTAGSRPPTGSSGSCAGARPATPAPPATRAIYQDGALSLARVPAPRSTSASPTSSTTSSSTRCSPLGARAGGLTARGRGLDRAAGGHRGRGRQRRRARDRAGRAGRSSPGQMLAVMGTSTCHVMNGDALAEVPGMCGVVDGGIIAGAVGLRGRPERRRRHLRLVRRQRRAAALPRRGARARRRRARLPVRARGRAGGRRARPGRARLAERQPLGAGRPRAQRADRRADARAPAPRTSTAR